MVTQITALTRTGLKSWVIQQLSAALMAIYFIGLAAFFMLHPMLGFSAWSHLFACPAMKIATLFILLNILAHAWVGIWTVLTDYLPCSMGRGILQILIIMGFFACLVWGVWILWS